MSKIEWTDRTWNPVTGCSKVSPGCAHCYAETIAKRLWPTSYPPIPVLCEDEGGLSHTTRPRQFTDVMTHEDRLLQPLSWRKPAKVFVNSMSDLFHEDVPDEFIDRVFSVMGLAASHTFQILTKRADRMRQYMTSRPASPTVPGEVNIATESGLGVYHVRWPMPNVWLGVSVENQHFADELIPLLLQTPAAVRFISAEPLLGPVDLSKHLWDYSATRAAGYEWMKHRAGDGLAWVIVGGESGPGARPFDLAWARSIVEQCKAAGVPVFVKQLGANVRTEDGDDFHGDEVELRPVVRLRHRKGGDMAEWPVDLRVRQFPEVYA